MRIPPNLFRTQRVRGSAMITVLLFLFLILALTASVLQWSLSERRLNVRAAYWLEARNAAEAVAEYGFSQISAQFSRYSNPPSFNPTGSNPLVLPPTSFFSGGNVAVTSVELIGGSPLNVTTSGLYFVDPADPNNQFDPLKGQNVYRRDVQVLAKATVQPPGGGPAITAYVTEKCSVRGAPLFANAIFYGKYDLEVFPGPVFNIYGPVHTNGNMFVSSQGNSLNFYGPVSTSGNIYHSWGTQASGGQGTGNEALGTSPVTFVNGAGTQVSMKDSSGVWQDSTRGADATTLFDSNGHFTNTTTAAATQLATVNDPSFRQYAAQTWGGNLQTAAMGVQSYNPISFNQPIDAAGDLPDPHVLIDPPKDTTYLNSDPTYTSAKTEVEKQKYANQAGLYVKVTVTPGTNGNPDTAVATLYSWPGSDTSSTPAFPTATGARQQIGQLTFTTSGAATTSNEPTTIIKFVPYKASATGGTATGPGTKYAYTATGSGSNWKIQTTTTPNVNVTYNSSVINYGGSSIGVVGSGSVSSSGGGTPSSSTGTTTYATQSAANSAITTQYGAATTYQPSSLSASPTSSATVAQALYDQRQDAGVNLVQVDIGALNSAMATMASGTKGAASIVDNSQATPALWGPGTSGGFSLTSVGSTGWNGAVYVEVSGTPGQTSVAVTNGQVASASTPMLPTVNGDSNGNNLGLTIATNAPMYVVGNLNSTGANATATSATTTPDDGYTDAPGTTRSSEIPVALAADAITILSPNYFSSSSTNTVPTSNPTTNSSAYASNSTNDPTATNSVEIAAAFITGLVQTSATASSGGVHNLPRFIENWGSKYVTIRGSLVSLYLSNVATAPWGSGYYGPPNRNWGFDKIFQNGNFPPLTPKVMSYRRTQFGSLSATGYATAKHTLWPSLY